MSNEPHALQARDLRGLQDHRVLYGVGFGIRKSRAARDVARAFVGFRDRCAREARCEREATGRARERAKGKPLLCTREHPRHKGQDRMVRAIKISHQAPNQDLPLVAVL